MLLNLSHILSLISYLINTMILINHCQVIFPESLKYAEVRVIYKKDETNYKPIIVIINISKVYERLMCSEMFSYINNIVSKLQCDFHKRYNTEQCLLSTNKEWQRSLHGHRHAEAFLTNLYKAFDSLHGDLLITKQNA